MLRITTEKGANATSLKLEGRLAGPWVDELARAWATATADEPGKGIVVDLCQVSSLDVEGRNLLELMYKHGAQLKASGCLMTCLVEEIRRAYDQSH